MVFRKTRHLLLMIFLLLSASTAQLAGTASDPLRRFIINGNSKVLERARNLLGGALLDVIDDDTHVIAVNSNTQAQFIEAVAKALGLTIEEDQIVRLPRGRQTAGTARNPRRSVRKTVNYFGTTAPTDYVNQVAAQKLRLSDSQKYATGRRAVVAIIDTGIDPNHPVLKNSLLRGRNYVGRSNDPAEWNDYTFDQGQDFAFLLDQGQDFAFLLDQGQDFAFLLDAQHPMFGHGTMVAGLVHLVAPDAMIMPLKAFDATGATTVSNLVRAIHDAVNDGADVINMSFSGETNSRQLENALGWARSRGVLIVASTGNDNSTKDMFPASLDDAIAVTSLNLEDDRKLSYANYGRYVDMSGPGAGLITTFPGTFAVVGGTSFTPPLVAGELLMLNELNVTGNKARRVAEDTADNVDAANKGLPRGVLGGKLDILEAVRTAGR